jgi:thioredoxin 1
MKRLQRIQGKERVPFSFSFGLIKLLFMLAILCFFFFSSGCTESNDSGNASELVEVTKDVNDSGNKAELVEVTNLSQFDEALNKGPATNFHFSILHGLLMSPRSTYFLLDPNLH